MKVVKAIGTFVLTIVIALVALHWVPVMGEQSAVVHAPRTLETDSKATSLEASYGFSVDGKKLEQKGYYIEGGAPLYLNMSKFGHVQVVPVSRLDSGQLRFILVDEQQNIVYELPDYIGEAYGSYDRIIAVYMRDVNADDLDDVIVIAQYTAENKEGWGVGLPVTGVYFQTEGGFTTVPSLDKELIENGITNNIAEVLGYLKRKQIGN